MKPITELWTPVLINDGIFKDDYMVSNMGRIKRKHCFKNGGCRYVLVRITNGVRPMVRMKGGDKQYSKSLAKLVLSSFHWREGCECANITYLDGNMKNCMLSNLRYAVDNGVYTNLELQTKNMTGKVRKKSVKQTSKTKKEQVLIRSCRTCRKKHCFSGVKTLTIDFGAEGCRDYKPRQTDN